MDVKTRIAQRAAKELMDGDIVNLGIGLPTQIPQYLDNSIEITLQSENGFLGLGPLHGEPIPDLVNAGGIPCGMVDGGAFFDSAMSFALIRGGHVDLTILGGLQVDQHGNLANWKIPEKMIPGMGGMGREFYAMNLRDTSGRDAWVRYEEYAYPLMYNKRPEATQRLRLGA